MVWFLMVSFVDRKDMNCVVAHQRETRSRVDAMDLNQVRNVYFGRGIVYNKLQK